MPPRPSSPPTGLPVLVLLAALALVAWVAVGCGDDSDAEVPTATMAPEGTPLTEPDDSSDALELDNASGPPALTVTAGGPSVEAGLGTFCWDGLCADAIGYITPEEALVSAAGDGLTATLASGAIAEVSVTATPASTLQSQGVCTVVDGIEPSGPLCGRDDPLLAWTGALGEGVNLPATAGGSAIEVDMSSLGPDRYVVDFFVRFEPGGDASYAVLLEVTG